MLRRGLRKTLDLKNKIKTQLIDWNKSSTTRKKAYFGAASFLSIGALSTAYYLRENRSLNTIIVGLGPVGLAYAIEACKQGTNKVIAISNRQDYTRNQIFRIDPDVFEYLHDLIEPGDMAQLFNEKKITKNLDSNGFYYVIKIKTLENILFKALSKYKNLEIIYNKDSISDIDKINHQVTLKKGSTTTKIKFKYLVAADGAHHPTLNKMHTDVIKYSWKQQFQMHNDHAIANYKLPGCMSIEEVQISFKYLTPSNPSISKLHEMGWPLFSKPEVRVFAVEDTVYIGTECPKNLNTNDKIREWTDTILRLHLSEEKADVLVRNNSELECGKFSIELNEANRTHLVLPPKPSHIKLFADNEACFFLAGDSLRKPHYQTGSGAVLGLQEAKNFGKFLRSKQTPQDLSEYENNNQEKISNNRKRIDKYLLNRETREKEALKEFMNDVDAKFKMINTVKLR